MRSRQRWVEAHRLTISELEQGSDYGLFIRDAREEIKTLADAVWTHGGKSHALEDARVVRHRLRLKFLSFTTGHRPDILDTRAYAVTANPLAENQTGIEWTHVLGGRVGNRYLLLCEKTQDGIWPSTVGGYLQWMIDRVHGQRWVGDEEEDAGYIVLNLEPEPSAAFLQRMSSLARIKQATVRIVRPNPGWRDLEGDLSREAQASRARRADVTMAARRGGSLSRDDGIIAAIQQMYRDNELDFAAIEGEKADGKMDHFSTKKLVARKRLSFRLDDGGQVEHQDAWAKLERMMGEFQ